MKIGLDAKRAFLNRTGLGNYSRNIIRSLIQYYPEHEYYLFTPKVDPTGFYAEIKDIANVKIIQPANKIGRGLWRSYGITKLINQFRLDVYHGLSNELPYNIKKATAKKVVTIHDLIPFKEDAFRNVIQDFSYRSKMRTACKNADLVTPISKATLEDIQQLFGTDPHKMMVIYQPIEFKHSEKLPEVKIKYQLPAEYILQVGTVEYRKNIQIIIRAMIRLKDENLHYVVVGKKTRFFKSLFSYSSNKGLINNIHFIDPVSNDELAAIYLASSAVMYPSLYEGFGLPIAEAIHFGKPVLTTAGGCFLEAGGPGAYYCNTSDVEEVAATILTILKTDNSRMIEAGKQHIAQFNSKAAADALIQSYLK
jgi:glycosyltransferase involved in cell wall biosynthesis